MLEEPLRILQLNVGKQKETQWSLLNDTDTARFDVLVVAEPYIFTLSGESKARVTSHHQWEAITPTVQRKEGHVRHSFRAMLWLNKNTQGQAIPIQSSDIAAVLIRSQGVPVLIFFRLHPPGWEDGIRSRRPTKGASPDPRRDNRTSKEDRGRGLTSYSGWRR